jgi:hypothetical protein
MVSLETFWMQCHVTFSAVVNSTAVTHLASHSFLRWININHMFRIGHRLCWICNIYNYTLLAEDIENMDGWPYGHVILTRLGNAIIQSCWTLLHWIAWPRKPWYRHQKHPPITYGYRDIDGWPFGHVIFDVNFFFCFDCDSSVFYKTKIDVYLE